MIKWICLNRAAEVLGVRPAPAVVFPPSGPSRIRRTVGRRFNLHAPLGTWVL